MAVVMAFLTRGVIIMIVLVRMLADFLMAFMDS
jgi:hypothetical protein